MKQSWYSCCNTLLNVKGCTHTVLHMKPSQKEGRGSPGIIDCFSLVTRHKWKHHALTPVRQESTSFTYASWMKSWIDPSSWWPTKIIFSCLVCTVLTYQSMNQGRRRTTVFKPLHQATMPLCYQLAAKPVFLVQWLRSPAPDLNWCLCIMPNSFDFSPWYS